MRSLGARHGEGVFVVFQAVLRFVFNRGAGGLFLHVFVHAAALNHEAFNHTVENKAVVETVFHVLFEVGGGFGGFFVVELDADGAEVGVEFDHVYCPVIGLEEREEAT